MNCLLRAWVYQLFFYNRRGELNLFVMRNYWIFIGGFDLGGEPRIKRILKQNIGEIWIIGITITKKYGIL